MTEILSSTLTTKPASNGEAPLPKRSAPKSLLPSTWISRTVKVSYGGSLGKEAIGTLLDIYPFGPILRLDGETTALAWDSVRSVPLVND